MKKVCILASAVLLTLGMASCERDDTTDPNTSTNPTDQSSGEWVDLGLPSGLLWATCNLGATSPEQYGDYYVWGETSPKIVYTRETYSYGDRTGESEDYTYTLYKYNTSSTYGTVDNLTTLQPSDDAATQQLGTSARIPTKAQWQELLDNTNVEWITLNGVAGRKFTATNGNSLFLPAAGWRNDTELDETGTNGYYWSASLVDSSPTYAWYAYFNSGGETVSFNSRFLGQSVRAVRSRSQN